MRSLLSVLIVALFLLPQTVMSQSAEEKGLAIAVAADETDRGFQDFTADMEMILRNKHGQESTRSIRIKTLEVENDGDKSLTVFDTPRDVKGTAFLTFTHKTGDDDQWLFLPALKRVKRIASRNKSGSFMGSEFSYEDIASQEVEKYMYKWIRDEDCLDLTCHVTERYPVDKKNSGYSRQVVWMDTKEYRVQKVEYYDRKNSLLKTLTVSGYQQYKNKFWRAGEMVMNNHQNNKSTRLLWRNYRFATGLSDRDFNKNSLKRVR